MSKKNHCANLTFSNSRLEAIIISILKNKHYEITAIVGDGGELIASGLLSKITNNQANAKAALISIATKWQIDNYPEAIIEPSGENKWHEC